MSPTCKLVAWLSILGLLAGCPGAPLTLKDEALGDATVGGAYSHPLTASGGSGALAWSGSSLPPGLSVDSGGLLSGTPTDVGSSPVLYTVVIQVKDKAGATAQKSFPLTVYPQLALVAALPKDAEVGAKYKGDLTAQGGKAPLAWSVAGGALPPGLSLSAAGSVTGTPTAAGDWTFTAQAMDANGVAQGVAVSLHVHPPPAFVPPQLAAGNVGSSYLVSLQVTGGLSPYAFAVGSGSLPPGLTLDSSGTLSGVPSAAGSFSFSVTVTDGGALSASVDLTLRILANPPPRITTTSLSGGIVGVSYSATLAVAGGVPPYTWTFAPGASLPGGISLSSSGGLAGTPTDSGTFSFQASVSDGNGQSASQALKLGVGPPLQLTPFTLGDAYVSIPYSETLTASGGLAPLLWTLTPAPVPPGMGFSAAIFSGTPTLPGLYSDAVQVSDSAGQSSSQPFPFRVYALPKVASGTLGDGAVGAAYSQTLAGINGKLPYTFTVTAGGLPPGLTLAASGALSGTPSTAGAFPFTVQLSDANGRTSTRDYTLSTYGGVAVTTGDLPDAYAGTAYSHGLGAAGGVTPYSWAVVGGALPAGVSLSPGGTLSGTPSGAAGAYSFNVQVTDSTAGTALTRTRSLTLNLYAPPSISTGALADAYAQQPYSALLDVAGGKPPYHFGDSALSNGLSLVDGGLITGTPAASSSAATFTFTVTDGNGVTAVRALSITTYDPVLITTTSLPAGQATVSYSATLVATGGKAPVTWTVPGSNLPPGLVLGSNGALSGAPSKAGSWSFTVMAADANGSSDSRDLSVLVSQ